jgi:hypothetical protein
MSCPRLGDHTDGSMTYPEDTAHKTANEVLETIVDILTDYLKAQPDTSDALLPILSEINARAMRALIHYQPFRDHEIRVGRRDKDGGEMLDRIITITAMRAARVIESALNDYAAGWRLEITRRKNGSEYARWRRSLGSGKREMKYLGLVVSGKRR